MHRRPVALVRLALAGALLGPGAALAADPFDARHCRLSPSAEARVIRVEYETPGSPVPCALFDSGDGRASVARANNQAGYCEDKAAKLVRTLERGGYACETASPRETSADGDGTGASDGVAALELPDDALPEVVADPSISLDLFAGRRSPADVRTIVASRAFDIERDAHRFDAELHVLYPNVTTRVVRSAGAAANDPASGPVDASWRVLLGMGGDEIALRRGLDELDPAVAVAFELLTARTLGPALETLRRVPADWQRYAVVGCWAEGHRSTGALSACAGIAVDVDAFVSCVGGGPCSPARLAELAGIEDVELVEALGSGDPVAAARELVKAEIAGCGDLVDPTDLEFAECAALAVAPPELASAYGCYERGGTRRELLECAGGPELAAYTELYERCSTGARDATLCALESFDVPVLSQASQCVELGERSEMLRCALDANVGVDEAAVLACLDDDVDVATRAHCIADPHLDDEHRAVLGCMGSEGDALEKGVCAARGSALLGVAELDAIECLDRGVRTGGAALPGCIGGRFLSDEIASCLERGIRDSSCLEPRTILAAVAGDEIESALGVDVRTLVDADLGTLAGVAACRKKVELFRRIEAGRPKLEGLLGQLFGKPRGNPGIKRLQVFLVSAGYDAGKPDGLMGPGTAAALSAFQGDCGLGASGEFDGETRALLGM